jgi:hypothetical protein
MSLRHVSTTKTQSTPCNVVLSGSFVLEAEYQCRKTKALRTPRWKQNSWNEVLWSVVLLFFYQREIKLGFLPLLLFTQHSLSVPKARYQRHMAAELSGARLASLGAQIQK